ncbi:MAG TPA: hypothetical protein VH041_14665 [Caldimonas sp.]|jgi:hypothetical protein|nr:hypothetical protein [Caldimonas sp.]HEX4235535.1 hypothetical protein [Caldimonas sp.]
MKLALVVMAAPTAMVDALCNHTCDLAPAIEHVQSAQLVSRHIDRDGMIVCVQRWRAKASVPALLRPHLETSLLDWTLTFERRPGSFDCRWHAESAARQLPGRCHGTLEFRAAIAGRATRIDLRCDLPATNEGLQTIFARLLAQHWRKLVDAAAQRASPSLPTA